jgi:hypothetical protein
MNMMFNKQKIKSRCLCWIWGIALVLQIIISNHLHLFIISTISSKEEEGLPKRSTWQAEYRLDENKNAYLQERLNFADELLVKQYGSEAYLYLYHYQASVAPSPVAVADNRTDTWYVIFHHDLLLIRKNDTRIYQYMRAATTCTGRLPYV